MSEPTLYLSRRQLGDLKALKNGPLWNRCPPNKADDELYSLHNSGLVTWDARVGWLITERGRRACLAIPASLPVGENK